MAQFMGTVEGSRGETSRLGGKESGVTTRAAGWNGCIRVDVSFDETTGKDMYTVLLTPWKNSGGETRVLAHGVLDASAQ